MTCPSGIILTEAPSIVETADTSARVSHPPGQLSTEVFGYTVSVKGTFSALGVGASGHVNWSSGLDVGGSVIFGLVGAGLTIVVRPTPNP